MNKNYQLLLSPCLNRILSTVLEEVPSLCPGNHAKYMPHLYLQIEFDVSFNNEVGATDHLHHGHVLSAQPADSQV